MNKYQIEIPGNDPIEIDNDLIFFSYSSLDKDTIEHDQILKTLYPSRVFCFTISDDTYTTESVNALSSLADTVSKYLKDTANKITIKRYSPMHKKFMTIVNSGEAKSCSFTGGTTPTGDVDFRFSIYF